VHCIVLFEEFYVNHSFIAYFHLW